MTLLAAAAVAALAFINVTADNLGYGGVMIGAKRFAVERTLGRRLPPIVDDDTPACGAYKSLTHIGGRAATIQWSDRTPRAEVESIIVRLEGRPRGPLPRRLVQEGGSFHPPKNNQVVLFFSGENEPPLLYIYMADCTD